MRTRRDALIAAVALAAVAIAWQPSVVTAQAQPRLTPAEKRGLVFAKHRCSACHAVVADRISPNSAAPSFQDIANRPAVTRPTLREFLRDSHNYPSEMNFRLEDEHIEDLSEYMGTLERPNYRPVM